VSLQDLVNFMKNRVLCDMTEIKPRAYSVSEVNYYLKEYLAEDDFLRGIFVRGEISGYKEHSSGHIYFALKEQNISLRAVMFKTFVAESTFRDLFGGAGIGDGMEVVVYGSIGFYEGDGTCRIYAEEIFPGGMGKDEAAFEELKNRLATEGLFAPEHKKNIPWASFEIGVITSAEGAAWADIQKIAYERWPEVKLKLFPTAVQGEAAPKSIAKAITEADLANLEVLIVARGGGATSDLAAFNTEEVVRAIAKTQTPIISGIGHETDITLADLAADMRAATPSHAAQIAVTEKETFCGMIKEKEISLKNALLSKIDKERAYLTGMEQKLLTYLPQTCTAKENYLQKLEAALQKTTESALAKQQNRLGMLIQQLKLLDPLATLSRGYAICHRENGQVLSDAALAAMGDNIRVQLAKGGLICEVLEKEGN
jgi:exodeoxyribonuclease VII large subunit